jgi:hypothetical protein
MKINGLILILLGGFLALDVCPKSAAQPSLPDVIESGSGFGLFADPGNKVEGQSSADNYTAKGSISSIIDGSAISGAQTISYGGGVFTGSGRLLASVGKYLGSNSQTAFGDTSVYILFEITNSFHYQFTSSVKTEDNVKGFVSFNGFSNSFGTVMANGILGSNLYELQALMGVGSNNADGSGVWSYSLSLIPSDIMPGRFSAAQKSVLYAQMSELRTLGNQMIGFADLATSASQRTELLAAAQGLFDNANFLALDFLDPLDTNYTVLPQAVALPVTPLGASNGITLLEAQHYNAWLTNLSQTAGFSAALTTSINRAQGAAFARDSYWETLQMNAAVNFEAQLAGLADQEPALRSNLVAEFRSAGFPAITVTSNDATALQMQITTNGLPAILVSALTALGADPETITNIQNNLLTADPATMSGSFPASLSNSNLDSASHALAAGLRDASLVLINPTVLPNGRLRFDLPTEPEYVYTVQFNKNLTNPAGWMALFSNKATTTSISFTNTALPTAQAGFYRASHN